MITTIILLSILSWWLIGVLTLIWIFRFENKLIIDYWEYCVLASFLGLVLTLFLGLVLTFGHWLDVIQNKRN